MRFIFLSLSKNKYYNKYKRNQNGFNVILNCAISNLRGQLEPAWKALHYNTDPKKVDKLEQALVDT